jgi:hypothetical protein
MWIAGGFAHSWFRLFERNINTDPYCFNYFIIRTILFKRSLYCLLFVAFVIVASGFRSLEICYIQPCVFVYSYVFNFVGCVTYGVLPLERIKNLVISLWDSNSFGMITRARQWSISWPR